MKKSTSSICFILSLLLSTFTTAAEKPNVLFLFADDLTYEAIREFGYTDIDTPNLDKLVKRGTTFSHAYNAGSWSPAVCQPSRAMLMTGRFLWDTKKVDNKLSEEVEAGRLWPQLMKQAGYDTYYSGKWHVRAPIVKVFDTVANERPGMPNQTPEGYNRPIDGKPDPWDPADPKFEGFWKGGKHWSEVVRDDGIKFLGQASKSDNPFFMVLAFNAAHDPRQAPQEYLDMYPEDRIELPENFLPEYPYKEDIGAGKSLRDEKLAPFPRTEHSVKVNRREYYALITHMDAQIGLILDALEKSGKADNTWIFFSADHGLGVGHHGLMGKQNLYDHSVRVPFIVAGPDVPEGKTISEPIYYQAVMPTSLALAGAKIPDTTGFQNLLPIIRGERKSAHEAIYGAYLGLQRSITKDGWKLILYPKIGKARLYHLTEDSLEMNDLAEDPAHRDKMKYLFTELRDLQRGNGDPLELSQSFPDL